MSKITIEKLNKHIKTHSERSVDDKEAVAVLNMRFCRGGKINTNFSAEDKWPNTDGDFELVPDPSVSRKPKQKFVVQIKGTCHENYTEDGMFKYHLKNLAFPAYVAKEVTLDPSILFVVFTSEERGKDRVFWKYISANFISLLDFDKGSATISFSADEEIKDSDESVDQFVKRLNIISDNHSYMKQLECREYTGDDIKKIILTHCENISEDITTGAMLNYSRDKTSRKMYTELYDLCKSVMLMNGLKYFDSINLRTAWELTTLNIGTKFLSTFYQGLRYIGLRTPEDGQYERLMLKYYGFLWKIRDYLAKDFGLAVLGNLEKLLEGGNEEDKEYNRLLAAAIESTTGTPDPIAQNRYYIQKKVPFYVDSSRYFEITLQLANKYATKYNRLTVYSKMDISTNYSIQIGWSEEKLKLWDTEVRVKVVTNWRVSIEPSALNKMSKILMNGGTISSRNREYAALMEFLTNTGISLLDFVDFQEERFNEKLSAIYEKIDKPVFKETILAIHKHFNSNSEEFGKSTIRYALIRMREDVLEDLVPEDQKSSLAINFAFLSKSCYPFEKNPFLYNLPNRKTNGQSVSSDVIRAVGHKKASDYSPYIRMKYLIESTGEIYHPVKEIDPMGSGAIRKYNSKITPHDRDCGLDIKTEGEYAYIAEYARNTLQILRYLTEASLSGNAGQAFLNRRFVEGLGENFDDDNKKLALLKIFVESRVLMIYGAAGTGKTTLMNYISDLMTGRSKLFVAKTHTALENLRRRIKSPGSNSNFVGIDSFIRSKATDNYDVVFVDECSVIDNRTMMNFLNKISKDSLLVFAGDIYQIESIDFGNWFYYAKDILPEKSVAELTNTWRTRQENIQNLWEAVRFTSNIITEMLVIDGPFSENIGKKIFERADDDEVVLCLNYDGKFGLNCLNSYFQDANPSEKEFNWAGWRYKVGDPVLFNESRRFPMLYNNLKGTIVAIEGDDSSIEFTVEIPINLTAVDVRGSDLEIVSYSDEYTRIRFRVYDYLEDEPEDRIEDARLKSIVPFQLAYAVSIHKAQGLEYNSIKVVIPSSSSEKITHGIFYTAITRAKSKLKIFWSSETMEKIIDSFNAENTSNKISLDIIKSHLERDA